MKKYTLTLKLAPKYLQTEYLFVVNNAVTTVPHRCYNIDKNPIKCVGPSS